MVTVKGTPPEHNRADDFAALSPLVDLCKMGRLFEVQAWIKEGKPVNLPLDHKKGSKARSPLEVAIECGFHSLVQVLLEGGALQESMGYQNPMDRALRAKRLDIIQLLVKHGFDPKMANLDEVFATWDPQIIRFFIEKEPDLQTGNPFAHAFCNRVQSALGLFKECLGAQPHLQEQANIALRYHCKEGNLKWVSLMLWAGADPLKPGSDNPNDEPVTDSGQNPDQNQMDDPENEDFGLSALEFAALYGHFKIFDLKPIRAAVEHLTSSRVLSYLTKGEGIEVLQKLLKKGVSPNDQVNGGCSAIQFVLEQMSWRYPYSTYSWQNPLRDEKIDTSETRDYLKAIHILALNGAKWIPKDKSAMNSARTSLLRLKPEYTVEFVWIMNKFKACERTTIDALLGTLSMTAHTATLRRKLNDVLTSWD